MPLIDVKLIEGASEPEQKQRIVRDRMIGGSGVGRSRVGQGRDLGARG
jgi:hypothetical protein